MARWSTASVGGTGTVPATVGLYFDGLNANAANGGNPVPIYSPNPWEDGSSGSPWMIITSTELTPTSSS